MHPGQPQRRDEWERSSAWPAHRASPGSRGAPQRPSASGQTHPAGAGSSFRGLPLPRPVSVVEGALALLRPIRGSPPPAREMSTAPAGPTPSVYTRARRNPGSRPGPGPASGAPSRAAPAEPPAHTACTRSWAIYRLRHLRTSLPVTTGPPSCVQAVPRCPCGDVAAHRGLPLRWRGMGTTYASASGISYQKTSRTTADFPLK
jgi:hypothetical protein